MSPKLFLAGVLFLALAGSARADIVCPDSSYCTVSFTNPARNRITIEPNGGFTFAGAGITIRLFLKNCNGAPLVGVPAQEILISNGSLCICPGGNIADAATDINGSTTFTGTIKGGGCAEFLTVFADGVEVCTLNNVKTNSTDAPPASPCYVDAADLSAFSTHFGTHPQMGYSICFDYNFSGLTDESDLAFWASTLGGHCQ